MAHYQFETKKQLVEFLPFQHKSFIQVTLYNKQAKSFGLIKVETVYIALTDENLKKLQSYKSIAALVKYAKANQIDDSASDAKCSDSTSSTSYPAPVPAKFKERGFLIQVCPTVADQLTECLDSAAAYNPPLLPSHRVPHLSVLYQYDSYHPIR